VKYLLSIMVAGFFLLFIPKLSFAALDCTNNPDSNECMCFLDTGGQPAGPEDIITTTTDTAIDCEADCDNLNGVSYQFNECIGTELSLGANTALENRTTYSVCTTNPADFRCMCRASIASQDVRLFGPLTEDACQTTCGVGGLISFKCIAAPSAPPLAEPIAPKRDPVIPILNVPIPGLDFANSLFQNTETGTVTSNFLGLYIQAVYRFLLVAMSLIAVVMLMIGGLEYTISGGSAKRVEKAKTRIKNAVIGLILLFAAYDIAFLLDPATVTFGPLSLIDIRGVSLDTSGVEEEEQGTANSALTGAFAPVEGTHIINAISGHRPINIDPEGGPMLIQAADAFFTMTGKNVVVSSADRDLTKQATLFYKGCLAHGGVCSPVTCNPADSSVVKKVGGRYTLVGDLAGVTDPNLIISGIVSHADLSRCPHTSRVAVDVWCEGSGNFTADVDCQVKLMQAMVAAGFCRLSAEAWHFEINDKKVSSSCSITNTTSAYTRGGTPHNPPATCGRWNFKEDVCVSDKAP
jgi:hypothetical protein